MLDKAYVKIEGIKGPVKVDGFTDCFEAQCANQGAIVNQFAASNNGQAFGGVPSISNLELVIKNCTGDVSSLLEQYVLKAQPLTSIKVSQITLLNGKETETYGMEYTKAHIIRYDYDSQSRDIMLVIGNFATMEIAHYNIAEDGSVKPNRVKYDLTKASVA